MDGPALLSSHMMRLLLTFSTTIGRCNRSFWRHSYVLDTSEFPWLHTAEAIKTKCLKAAENVNPVKGVVAVGHIKQFKKALGKSLEKKFHLQCLDPAFLPVLCSAVDPRFCNLDFFEDEADRAALRFQACADEEIKTVPRHFCVC